MEWKPGSTLLDEPARAVYRAHFGKEYIRVSDQIGPTRKQRRDAAKSGRLRNDGRPRE